MKGKNSMPVQPTKEISLYNGKINIGFWENQHRYSLIINGKPERTWLLSVTAATGMIDKSRVLMKWATNLAKEKMIEDIDEIKKLLPTSGSSVRNKLVEIIENACNLYNVKREEAATKGSAAHSWIESYINGEKPAMPEDENVIASINAFLDWEKQHKVKWLETEQIVYSKKYGYVGLFDALAVIDRKTVLIDFKTSKGVYNDYKYQISAYRAAYEEETGKKLSGNSLIVRFDKETAEFEVHECTAHDKDFKAFLGALAIKVREKEYDAIWKANNK